MGRGRSTALGDLWFYVRAITTGVCPGGASILPLVYGMTVLGELVRKVVRMLGHSVL